MRMRRTAVAALLAAGIVVPTLSTAAVAFAQPAATSAAQRAGADKAAPKPIKTRKAVRTPFAATGKVTAVDAAAGTVTLLATGGTKDVRKRTVTVTVPASVRIKAQGQRITLATIVVGAKITVVGKRAGGSYTATHVQVSQKVRPVVKPSPTPTVEPTPTVDPTPTVTPTDPTPSTSPTPDDGPIVDPEEENSDDLSA
jgi:hypothetical protein